ncbi:hypothetical protein [Anabaena lutea]|uniref:Uncharacterized protein n=1 Tax=Anabaena lutea FACHB-196 TaxID=2692881 RepID=A0ABR8FN06_9NOST|nr:hypothetical protein [Anabaena lutea]MBD2571067.1 hypothetical protein [Anabaena lutea FACHB-196]
MALPDGYKPWEHLQDMLRRDHNKLLARYFKDLGPNWEPEIGTTRGAIRTAVTIQDRDTSTITLIRLFYFYVVLGYAFRGLAPVFGVPSQQFQEAYELHPQIFLYFSQDRASVPDGLRPVEAEISFRVMGHTKESMTPAKALPFASRIAEEFTELNKGITFNKGKQIVSYADPKNGLKTLKIFALSQAEGVDVIKKVCKILLLPFSDDLIGLSDKPKKSSVTKPVGNEVVYGKSVKKKRWRPSAKVRFRFAYMVIDNREFPISLVDTTGRFPEAIITKYPT